MFDRVVIGVQWHDGVVTSTLGILQTSEDGRAVKIRPVAGLVFVMSGATQLKIRAGYLDLPAQLIDAAIDSDEGASAHVADHSIVLDGQVS